MPPDSLVTQANQSVEEALEIEKREAEANAEPEEKSDGIRKSPKLPVASPREHRGTVDAITRNRDAQLQKEIGPVEEEPAATKPEGEEEAGDDGFVDVKIYGETKRVPKADVDAAGGVEAYQLRAAYEAMPPEKRGAWLAKKIGESDQVGERAAELERQNAELKAALDHERTSRAAAGKGDGMISQPDSDQRPEGIGKDWLTEAQRNKLAQMSEEYSEDVVEIRRDNFILHNKLEASQNQRALDPDSIADKALEKMGSKEREKRLKEREEQRKEANRYFATHFSHIEADPDLEAVARRKARELMSDPEHQHLSLVEIAKLSGQHAEEFKARLTGGKQGPFDTVVERKRGMPPPDSPTQVKDQPAPEPKRQNPSEVVAEMASRRPGGVPLTR